MESVETLDDKIARMITLYDKNMTKIINISMQYQELMYKAFQDCTADLDEIAQIRDEVYKTCAPLKDVKK